MNGRLWYLINQIESIIFNYLLSNGETNDRFSIQWNSFNDCNCKQKSMELPSAGYTIDRNIIYIFKEYSFDVLNKLVFFSLRWVGFFHNHLIRVSFFFFLNPLFSYLHANNAIQIESIRYLMTIIIYVVYRRSMRRLWFKYNKHSF